jgi:hypothetical protein
MVFLPSFSLVLALALGQEPMAGVAKGGKTKGTQQTPPTTPTDWLRVLSTGSTHSSLGQYLGGKRFGYEIETEGPVLWNGKLAWRIVEETAREEMADGKPVRETMQTTSIHSLEGEGPLIYFHQVAEENGKRTERLAVPMGKGVGLKLVVNRDGRLETREVEQPKASLSHTVRMNAWLSSEPEPGTRMTSWETEWDDENPNRPTVYTYVGKEEVGGIRANRVRCEMDGARMDCLVTDQGKPLSIRVGPLQLKQEPENQVRLLQPGAVDLAEALSIPLDGLKDPKLAPKVNKAVWLMSGLEETGFRFPEDDRQKLVTRADDPKGTVRLVTLSEPLREKPEELIETDRKQMLAATPTLQSQDPRLKAWALKQVGVAQAVRDRAALLVGAVNRHLAKTMAANAEDALSVLDQAKGDCTEHTLLFVAAARSCGIPAREVTGLVPGEMAGKSGTRLAMVWHAWAEYHDGTAWQAVDPTWNQASGVDATHVKLATGPTDWSWMNLLGVLRVNLEQAEFRR